MNELKPCPFCGGEAIMHEGEFPSKHTRHKKEIPKGARFIRSVKFPDGHVICVSLYGTCLTCTFQESL